MLQYNQDYSFYTLDCYNVLKHQDYSYYTLDCYNIYLRIKTTITVLWIGCYYILKDQYSFHKFFLHSYYFLLIPCSLLLLTSHYRLPQCHYCSYDLLLQYTATFQPFPNSQDHIPTNHHSSDLSQDYYKTNTTKHHHSAVQTVAGVSCQGIATWCTAPSG